MVAEAVDYLNCRTGRSFKAASKATVRHARARVAEGYGIEDFKRVIDVKAAQWENDPNMSRYLRPETLFGPKFESYLNETPCKEVHGYDKYEDHCAKSTSGCDSRRSFRLFLVQPIGLVPFVRHVGSSPSTWQFPQNVQRLFPP